MGWTHVPNEMPDDWLVGVADELGYEAGEIGNLPYPAEVENVMRTAFRVTARSVQGLEDKEEAHVRLRDACRNAAKGYIAARAANVEPSETVRVVPAGGFPGDGSQASLSSEPEGPAADPRAGSPGSPPADSVRVMGIEDDGDPDGTLPATPVSSDVVEADVGEPDQTGYSEETGDPNAQPLEAPPGPAPAPGTAETKDVVPPPATVAVTMEEGGAWMPFTPHSLSNPRLVHAVQFDNGWTWDSINGWRGQQVAG